VESPSKVPFLYSCVVGIKKRGPNSFCNGRSNLQLFCKSQYGGPEGSNTKAHNRAYNHTHTYRYNPKYIANVDVWWGTLLPQVVPYMYENGGPIIMVQIENEYGSYGNVNVSKSDLTYMQHLVALARKLLGPRIVLYTTDFGNFDNMHRGSLPGDTVITIGDFGPGSNVSRSRDGQNRMNLPGKNPAMCSEYYSGWYTYWGQVGATNTSAAGAAATLKEMLEMVRVADMKMYVICVCVCVCVYVCVNWGYQYLCCRRCCYAERDARNGTCG
jgi:hypothetical protein